MRELGLTETAGSNDPKTGEAVVQKWFGSYNQTMGQSGRIAGQS